MNTVLDNLLPLLVTALTPIVLFYVNKLIGVIATKIHLDNVANLTDTIDGIVTKAIQAAEEWAAQQLGGTPAPTPTPTPTPTPAPVSVAAKMEHARAIVQHELACKQLPAMENDHVDALLHAAMWRRRVRDSKSPTVAPVAPVVSDAPEAKKIPGIVPSKKA